LPPLQHSAVLEQQVFSSQQVGNALLQQKPDASLQHGRPLGQHTLPQQA
jgi:hypothetical protein